MPEADSVEIFTFLFQSKIVSHWRCFVPTEVWGAAEVI